MNLWKIDKQALELARKQFCLDIGLPWEEYQKEPHKKVYICKAVYGKETQRICSAGARNYEGRVDFFHAMICLGQLFLVVDEQIYDWAVEKFMDCAPEWFCQYENLRKIDRKLQEYGYTIKDTHVYFLPEAETTENVADKDADSGIAFDRDVAMEGHAEGNGVNFPMLCWYNQEEILRFQGNNRFTSAICFSKTQPDMLAVAARKEDAIPEEVAWKYLEVRPDEVAWKHRETVPDELIGKHQEIGVRDADQEFDQARLSGMAGVSADGEYLWQIGINVIPEAAGKGLAHYLVRLLKKQVQKLGKVPFYGTSESHTVSQTVGLKAGFVPAWTEVYVRVLEQEETA